jgi:hypothetical protein
MHNPIKLLGLSNKVPLNLWIKDYKKFADPSGMIMFNLTYIFYLDVYLGFEDPTPKTVSDFYLMKELLKNSNKGGVIIV